MLNKMELDRLMKLNAKADAIVEELNRNNDELKKRLEISSEEKLRKFAEDLLEYKEYAKVLMNRFNADYKIWVDEKIVERHNKDLHVGIKFDNEGIKIYETGFGYHDRILISAKIGANGANNVFVSHFESVTDYLCSNAEGLLQCVENQIVKDMKKRVENNIGAAMNRQADLIHKISRAE